MDITAIGETWRPHALSILRIVAALVILQYGLAKLVGWPVVKMFENLPLLSLFGIAGIFELVGGTLLLLGLFTRPVAFVLAGEMAVAYFTTHARMSPYPQISMGVPAILNCFIFLYLVAAGAGPWSIDAMIARSRRPRIVANQAAPQREPARRSA